MGTPFRGVAGVPNEGPRTWQLEKGVDMPNQNSESAVAELTVEREVSRAVRQKRQPRYHVILWDDDDHTYEYVISMMKKLFGLPYMNGHKIAETVDRMGRAVCLTTTLEHAELKRDQIQSFGRDQLLPRCAGSMTASVEPEGNE